MMRALLISWVWIGSCAVLRAQSGIGADLHPSQVKPGELFELRVRMEREEFGRFKLKLPGHGHLHRVAREVVPVRLEDGLYRQEERWVLQADSSGEFVMERGIAMLETRHGVEEVALPELRVTVLPYAETDENAEPMELPVEDERKVLRSWGWLLGGVLLAIVGWLLRPRKPGGLELCHDDHASAVDRVLADLDSGKLDAAGLMKVLDEGSFSKDLRELADRVLFAGGSDLDGLASGLRKEASR